jgi:hypothetical protein
MSMATTVMDRYDYNKFVVLPDFIAPDPDRPGGVRHIYTVRWGPMFARNAVRGAFVRQEDAERMARVLTERNEPF